MIEEFGKEVHLESGSAATINSVRGPFYRKVYQQLQDSVAADGPLKGELDGDQVKISHVVQVVWCGVSIYPDRGPFIGSCVSSCKILLLQLAL